MDEPKADQLHVVCRYRDGSAEVRRSRRLVISFISTVVNYEYASQCLIMRGPLYTCSSTWACAWSSTASAAVLQGAAERLHQMHLAACLRRCSC